MNRVSEAGSGNTVSRFPRVLSGNSDTSTRVYFPLCVFIAVRELGGQVLGDRVACGEIIPLFNSPRNPACFVLSVPCHASRNSGAKRRRNWITNSHYMNAH